MIPPRALFPFLLAVAAAWAQSTGPIAIRNVTLHPASGPPVERGAVVIRDGLIEAAGANVTPPAGASLVEGIGLHVYPGLIDSLSHAGLPAPPARGSGTATSATAPAPQPANGPEDRPATSSWVHAQDLVRPGDKSVEDARSAGFTTAVVYPRQGILPGQGAAMNLAGEKPGAMVLAAPVAAYVRFENQRQGFPGSLMGVISYIRQLHIDAAYYDQERKAYAASARGHKRPDYDRALDGLLESPRLLLPASAEREFPRMIAFAAERKRPAVLYGGHEAWLAVESIRAAGAPVLFDLKWPARGKDDDPEAKESLRALERYDKAPSGPAALVKAGVPFGFYTSALEKPSAWRAAVKRAIDAGLDREDALRALTLWPARIYGFADRAGSIESGKVANLVVTSGDLFSTSTEIRYVFVDGIRYDPTAPASKEESR
ncbi:MAG: amidohydrolase family protein [Bryobacteraceae bacterium]